jgi:hypothetical protein
VGWILKVLQTPALENVQFRVLHARTLGKTCLRAGMMRLKPNGM